MERSALHESLADLSQAIRDLAAAVEMASTGKPDLAAIVAARAAARAEAVLERYEIEPRQNPPGW